MQSSSLSSLIETLVHTIEVDAAALRERYLLRQSLHALVRQAKVEQLADMRAHVRRLSRLDGMETLVRVQPADQGSAV